MNLMFTLESHIQGAPLIYMQILKKSDNIGNLKTLWSQYFKEELVNLHYYD